MNHLQDLMDHLETQRQSQLNRALALSSPVKWSEASSRVDRVMLPSLLFRLIVDGKLDMATLPDAISSAWVNPEFPASGGQHVIDMWSMVFHQALRNHPKGSVVSDEGVIVQHPPIAALYRGATHEGRLGMSWTSDLDRAKWFAQRFNNSGSVYVVDLDSVRPLGVFLRRGESEWVIEQPPRSAVTLYDAL